jgi:hypothetical protein
MDDQLVRGALAAGIQVWAKMGLRAPTRPAKIAANKEHFEFMKQP